MSSIFHLPVEIQKEFAIDNDGKASASQRGTARLAGVSQPAIRKLLLKLTDNLDVPEIFKSFAGYSFKGDNLDDVLVALIIESVSDTKSISSIAVAILLMRFN